MKKILLVLLLLLLMAAPAMADVTFQLPANFTQDDFSNLTRDLGLAISYVPLAPAEPLGGALLPGVDIGVEYTGAQIDENASYFTKAVTNPSDLPSMLPEFKAHAQVGLPVVPIDLGIVYASLPTTDIKLVGYELKYAILRGSVATPAVAIRGAYTKLSGIDVFDVSTKSLDLSISKGFAMLTPYAGIGQVWISGKAKVATSFFSDGFEANSRETKGFLGLKLGLGLINFVAEADFAKVKLYSLRMNLHF